MGYRSEVQAAIAMPSKHFFLSHMLAARLTTDDPYNLKFILEHSVIREMKFRPSSWVKGRDSYVALPASARWYIWDFCADGVKWYDSYPEVIAVHDILKKAADLGLATMFLRVGEDSTDVVDDWVFDSDKLGSYMHGSLGFYDDLDTDIKDEYVAQYEFEFEKLREFYCVYTSINNQFMMEEQRHTQSAEEVLHENVLV